ncbi:MAG: hypothetical protein JST23_04280 [Bacteroidetes bacterium]|nr:hypothetical protein [Bacteroidota bacterium]
MSFTIGLLSCKKDTTQNNVTNTQVEKIVKLEKVVFAKNISPNKIAKFAEQACSIRNSDSIWVAGTACIQAVGNSCNKVTDCILISTAAASGEFTKDEIDNKIKEWFEISNTSLDRLKAQ